MHHYFIAESHLDSDYFVYEEKFNDKLFTFNSCSDVFSKNCVDYGTKVLIKNIIKNSDKYKGRVLDVGCGYGALSVILEKFLVDCNFTLVDCNSVAVELAKKNKLANSSKNIIEIFESDLYSNCKGTFSHIISNPPIKTGKKILIDLITKGYDKLENGGSMTLVIKKNYGADSAKKLMESVFKNAEIWDRDKGYYILYSKKIG